MDDKARLYQRGGADIISALAYWKESLLDAYDILGVSPDDPVELIKDVYRKKSLYYHPDKGGDQEKFKRLTQAYELIMSSRGTGKTG